ncbi:hypothetical protein QYE76_031742 [Lolium multiflorum]|uniref:Uncharacterized protein n=1 Tax=Lolium multiflorum TaxID=4521 RepID=A0AAD8QVJ8_LOLMU|nr:hypothetical protein QYE76_031742 [Lolium multiflorum]
MATPTAAAATLERPRKWKVPGIVERRAFAEIEEKAEVNARAERFIRQFREDLKLERLKNSTTSTEGREDAMETRGRKADVTEAWKIRREKRWTLQAGTSARHRRNFRPDTIKTEDARTEELRPDLPPLMAGTSAPRSRRNFHPVEPQPDLSPLRLVTYPFGPLPINRHLPPPS